VSVPTPGGVVPPPRVLPGWNWVPPGGLDLRPQDLPWWVRTWLLLPLVDRYAHVWMWHHGLYSLAPLPPGGDGGEPSGDRSPRGPSGRPPALVRHLPLGR